MYDKLKQTITCSKLDLYIKSLKAQFKFLNKITSGDKKFECNSTIEGSASNFKLFAIGHMKSTSGKKPTQWFHLFPQKKFNKSVRLKLS